METSKVIGGSSAIVTVDVDFIFGAMRAFSHTPTEWRQIFAEAQVPYAKIIGCAKFGYRGQPRAEKKLRRAE